MQGPGFAVQLKEVERPRPLGRPSKLTTMVGKETIWSCMEGPISWVRGAPV